MCYFMELQKMKVREKKSRSYDSSSIVTVERQIRAENSTIETRQLFSLYSGTFSKPTSYPRHLKTSAQPWSSWKSSCTCRLRESQFSSFRSWGPTLRTCTPCLQSWDTCLLMYETYVVEISIIQLPVVYTATQPSLALQTTKSEYVQCEC